MEEPKTGVDPAFKLFHLIIKYFAEIENI